MDTKLELYPVPNNDAVVVKEEDTVDVVKVSADEKERAEALLSSILTSEQDRTGGGSQGEEINFASKLCIYFLEAYSSQFVFKLCSNSMCV